MVHPGDEKLQNVSRDKVLHGKDNLRQALEMCRSGSKNEVFLTGTPDKLMDELTRIYDEVSAGGGIVTNDKGEILFIIRHNVWDLPKGKLENGEEPAEGAKREVEEECGIKNLELKSFFANSYHTYQYDKSKPVLKKTLWYHFHTSDPGELTPQTEEGITEIHWLRPEELLPVMENTYKNIRYLVERFLKHHKL